MSRVAAEESFAATRLRQVKAREQAALPRLLDLHIEREAAVLVADAAESQSWRGLILQLQYLTLRRGGIGGIRDEQISCNALLNRNLRAGVLLISAKYRVHGKLRDSSDFFDA